MSIWAQNDFFAGLYVAWEPRHIDIDQNAYVGFRHSLIGRETHKAGGVVRDVVGHVGFVDGDAGELRQCVDHL